MVQTIAVASGKGGVGKTSLAVNCAVKLAMDSKRVALLDADFGLANAHIMLNQKVEANIAEFLEGKKSIDELVHLSIAGLKLIPGGSGVLEIMNIDSTKRWQVIRSLDHIKDDLEVLIVDTPAGASDSSIEFAAACDQILVVLVGEPTSFMDAYAFIKALHMEKGVGKVSIVVNLAKDASHANQSFNSFKKIVTQFLSVDVFFAGWLPSTQIISNSIVARKPFVLNPKADPSLNKKIQGIIQNIGEQEILPNKNIRFFDS